MTTGPEAADSPSRPPLRVISGDASVAEIAAVIAVLAAAGSGGAPTAGAGAGRSRWSAPAARLRSPLAHGPGAWRASARP